MRGQRTVRERSEYSMTCESFENKITFSCIGEPAPQKKSAKQNVVTEMLIMFSKQCTFSKKISESS